MESTAKTTTPSPLKRTLSVAAENYAHLLARVQTNTKRHAADPQGTTRQSSSSKKRGFITLFDVIVMIVTEPKSNQYKDKESGQMKTLPPVYSIKLLLTGHTLAQILEGGLGRWLPDPANPDAVYIVPFFGATEAEKPADLGYDVYRDLVTPTGEPNPFMEHLSPLATIWVEVTHDPKRPRPEPGMVVDIPGFHSAPSIGKPHTKNPGKLFMRNKSDPPTEKMAFRDHNRIDAYYAYMPLPSLVPAADPDIVGTLDAFKHAYLAGQMSGGDFTIPFPKFPDIWLYVYNHLTTVVDPATEKAVLALSGTCSWSLSVAGPYIDHVHKPGSTTETEPFLKLPLTRVVFDFVEPRTPGGGKGVPYTKMTIEIKQGATTGKGDIKVVRNNWESIGIRNPASMDILSAGAHLPPTFMQLTIDSDDTNKHQGNLEYLAGEGGSGADGDGSNDTGPTLVAWMGNLSMDIVGYLKLNGYAVSADFARTKLFAGKASLKNDVYKTVLGKPVINPIHDVPVTRPGGADRYPDLIHLNEYTGEVPWTDDNYTYWVLTNVTLSLAERTDAIYMNNEQIEALILKAGVAATLTWAIHKSWLTAEHVPLRPIPRRPVTAAPLPRVNRAPPAPHHYDEDAAMAEVADVAIAAISAVDVEEEVSADD